MYELVAVHDTLLHEQHGTDETVEIGPGQELHESASLWPNPIIINKLPGD
jgi:hypothetical protein